MHALVSRRPWWSRGMSSLSDFYSHILGPVNATAVGMGILWRFLIFWSTLSGCVQVTSAHLNYFLGSKMWCKYENISIFCAIHSFFVLAMLTLCVYCVCCFRVCLRCDNCGGLHGLCAKVPAWGTAPLAQPTQECLPSAAVRAVYVCFDMSLALCRLYRPYSCIFFLAWNVQALPFLKLLSLICVISASVIFFKDINFFYCIQFWCDCLETLVTIL